MATHALAPENSDRTERKNVSKFRKKSSKIAEIQLKSFAGAGAKRNPDVCGGGIVDRRTTSRRLVQRTSALYCTFNLPRPAIATPTSLGRVESIHGPVRPVLLAQNTSSRATLAQGSRTYPSLLAHNCPTWPAPCRGRAGSRIRVIPTHAGPGSRNTLS